MTEMGEEPNKVVQCSYPDCKIAETGKCVEGLEPTACGNYGKPLRPAEEGSEAPSTAPEMVTLSGADRLNPAEVRKLLRQTTSRVIAIVGPHDAGKTSLIASLYDQLQLGPVDACLFRGSRTLHAFEQACHDARAASQRGTPHSERTKRGEVRFYHLGLMDKQIRLPINLILGDRAGEEYREAGDDVAAAADFIEVARADVVTLLVDGERLASNTQRHNVRSELLLIVQALVDSGLLATRVRIAVVLTKLDAVCSSANAARVDSDLADDVERIREVFSTSLSGIALFRVAASPKEPGVQRGAGIAELLAYWTAEGYPVATQVVVRSELHPRVIGRLAEVEA